MIDATPPVPLVAKCLAKYGHVATAPAKVVPPPWGSGLVGPTITLDFKRGENNVELWFYNSTKRAAQVLSWAKPIAQQVGNTVGVYNGTVVYTYNLRPTKAQASVIIRCLA